MQKEFKVGTAKFLYNIVTSVETQMHLLERETKQKLTVWVFPDLSNPTKVVFG